MVDEIRVVEEDDTNNFQMLPADLARASPKTYNHVIPLDVAGSRPRLRGFSTGGVLAPVEHRGERPRSLATHEVVHSYSSAIQDNSARQDQLNETE